ncbi:unnamed protein product, partial [Heterosigma akashiwo]
MAEIIGATSTKSSQKITTEKPGAIQGAYGFRNLDRIKNLLCSQHDLWRSFLDGNRLSEWNKSIDRTAKIGNLPVLQWLHANRSEGCTKSAMDEAAGNGHLSVVEWLHAN